MAKKWLLDPNSSHRKSILALLEAQDHMTSRRPEAKIAAVKKVAEMDHHHQAQVAEIHSSHGEVEAKAYSTKLKPYLDEVRHWVSSGIPPHRLPGEAPSGGEPDRVKVEKPKALSAPKAASGSSDNTNKSEAALSKGRIPYNLGFNPNYHYKFYHELSPEQKRLALQYPGGESTAPHHMYPFERDSGEMFHGKRITIPSNPEPGHPAFGRKAQFPTNSDQGTPAVAPHHMRDASVTIHAPGTEHHGKPGVVQGYNPAMGKKVPVTVAANSKITTQFFDPEQVLPRKKADSEVVLKRGRDLLDSLKGKLGKPK